MATRVWRPIFIVHVYRLLRVGVEIQEIAKHLGVTRQRLTQWRKEKPELAEAMALAEQERQSSSSLASWVYERLSPAMQEVWQNLEQIHAECPEERSSPVERIEQLFLDGGKAMRQQMFLHALCVENFSPSHAMKKVNLTKRELDAWLANDPEFATLVDEVSYHKANFFEHQLVQLVNEGVPAAVLFANKTFNRDRGYANRVEVEHSGRVMHGVLDFAELLPYLEVEVRGKVLEAIRRHGEEKAKSLRQPGVIEVVSSQVAALPATGG